MWGVIHARRSIPPIFCWRNCPAAGENPEQTCVRFPIPAGQPSSPFCRLWCTVEIAAALLASKPVIFSCASVEVVWNPDGGAKDGAGAKEVRVVRGEGAKWMLWNCSFLVNIEAAECAVLEDKIRELQNIGVENFSLFNRNVAAALSSGATAVKLQVHEIDSFMCGEPGPLRSLPPERVPKAFAAACAAGQHEVLSELLRERRSEVRSYLAGADGSDGKWYPMLCAASNGHLAVVTWLLEAGVVAAEALKPTDGRSAVFVAAQHGQVDVVRVLLAHGGDPNRARTTDRATPLFIAAQVGRLDIVRVLLEFGADTSIATTHQATAVSVAQEQGHLEVSRLLAGVQ